MLVRSGPGREVGRAWVGWGLEGAAGAVEASLVVEALASWSKNAGCCLCGSKCFSGARSCCREQTVRRDVRSSVESAEAFDKQKPVERDNNQSSRSVTSDRRYPRYGRSIGRLVGRFKHFRYLGSVTLDRNR